MNKYLRIISAATAGLVLTGIVFWGAGCQPAKSAAPDSKGKFQIFATGNGTFLVDTSTGDSWVQINTVWVTTPKTTLPPEIYQSLLQSAFKIMQPGGTATNTGTGTPPAGGTTTPRSTPPTTPPVAPRPKTP